MPFQVIPGPAPSEGLENLGKIANMITLFQRTAIDEKLAQSRIEAESIQTKLLQQQLDYAPTFFEQQQRAGEANIAQSYQQTATSKSQQGAFDLQQKESQLKLYEAGLTQKSRLAATIDNALAAHQEVEKNTLTLADMRKTAKGMSWLAQQPVEKGGMGMNPAVADQQGSAAVIGAFQDNQLRAQQIKESKAREVAAEFSRSITEKTFGLDKTLKMAQLGVDFANLLEKNPKMAAMVKGFVGPEISGPLEVMSRVLGDIQNMPGILLWAQKETDDPAIQAALNEYNQAQQVQNYVAQPSVDPLTNVVTPSTEQRMTRVVDQLKTAYEKAKGKGPATQPARSASPEVENITEARKRRASERAVITELKDNPEKIVQRNVGYDTSAHGVKMFAKSITLNPEEHEKFINEDYPASVTSAILAKIPEEKRGGVRQALAQVEPLELKKEHDWTEPMVKRVRFFQALNQAVQTGRPDMVMEKVMKLYGGYDEKGALKTPGGLLPQDVDVLNAIMQTMGWSIGPKG